MSDSRAIDFVLRLTIGALMALFILVVIAFFVLIGQLPIGVPLRQSFDALFALSSEQATWYVTRAAGIIAYLLIWLSTVWGLAVSSKILDPVLARTFTYDFHEFISLLAIGFVALHVIVLLWNQYMPFSVAQILIPFITPYRPIWVGIGIITFYLTLLVSATFYIRRWIGTSAFRLIHIASFAAFFGTALHGLLSGTDSPLLATQLMYGGTTLVVVFLTVYWIVIGLLNKTQASTIVESPS